MIDFQFNGSALTVFTRQVNESTEDQMGFDGADNASTDGSETVNFDLIKWQKKVNFQAK